MAPRASGEVTHSPPVVSELLSRVLAIEVFEQPSALAEPVKAVVHRAPQPLAATNVRFSQVTAQGSSLNRRAGDGVCGKYGVTSLEYVNQAQQVVSARRGYQVDRREDVSAWVVAPIACERLSLRFLVCR